MIGCDNNINFGQPALKGRRLTVYDIVTKLYYEDDVLTATNDYQISFQDAKDALTYCKNIQCQKDIELINFCDGCLLRTIQDGWEFDYNNYIEFKENDMVFVKSKDEKVIFTGTLKELENSEFGKVTWLMAEEVEKMISEYLSNDSK